MAAQCRLCFKLTHRKDGVETPVARRPPPQNGAKYSDLSEPGIVRIGFAASQRAKISMPPAITVIQQYALWPSITVHFACVDLQQFPPRRDRYRSAPEPKLSSANARNLHNSNELTLASDSMGTWNSHCSTYTWRVGFYHRIRFVDSLKLTQALRNTATPGACPCSRQPSTSC